MDKEGNPKMKMFRYRVIAISGVLIIALSAIVSSEQDTARDDEDAYYGTAIIQGSVTMLNHPTLGKTPGNGEFLVFRRLDCKQCSCLVGVRASIDGNYQIRVAPGRYKLIVRHGTRERETKDVLAPSQQRIVNVGSAGTITNLDIETVLPEE